MTKRELNAIEKIRNNYTEKKATKLDELVSLNKKATRPSELFAYIFGVIGALVMGTGMAFVFPEALGQNLMLGVIVGVVGLIMVSVNYPIYKVILKKGKKKYSERIVALSNELLGE